MKLASLEVNGFRNYSKTIQFVFAKSNCVIYGPNAIGKTNLLEAIYFISRGQGFREKSLNNLINQNETKARVRARIYLDKTHNNLLEVNLENKAELVKKNFLINGFKKNLRDYKKRTISTVLFQPSNLNMITNSPSERRRFFDDLLIQVDYQYYQIKNNYSRSLYKRNKILEQGSNFLSNTFKETIKVWDQYLKKQSTYLIKKRQEICKYFNARPELNGINFFIKYKPNIFQAQGELIKLELKNKRTMSGPQLDDYFFYKTNKLQKKDLSIYGSRSEQRLAILWLKINELNYLSEKLEDKPIFLIDDIFSELDIENSRRILKVAKGYQAIITTANPDSVTLVKKDFKLIKL